MIQSRIAPTPSGFLHLGNAYNFLLTEALVRRDAGVLRLRIDDLDGGRVRADYLNDIFESLAWLGIAPDAGPVDAAAQDAVFSQRLRSAHYDAMLRRLVATGRVFACACSRAEVMRNAVDGQYAGTCRDLGIDLGTPDVVWRFRTAPEERVAWNDAIAGPQALVPDSVVRDVVIRRRDGVAAYQVASLSDDLHYGISCIVRGADLMQSTGVQLLLARLIGEAAFAAITFYHHPLLLDAAGAKLSKSAGSASLRAMRAAGLDPLELRAAAADWYGKWI